MARIDRKDNFTIVETINGEPFDPRKHTLREFTEEYAKTLGESGAKTYKANFTSPKSKIGKAFSEFADVPLVYILSETIEDEANPLIAAYQASDSVNTRRSIYSQVKGLEYNINAAMDRLNITGTEFPDGVPSLVSRVALPDKPKAKGARYQYDPGAVGKLQSALAEHAKNNPADAPVIRALEMQMLTGFRPGEVANMPLSAYKPPSEMSEAYGIYLSTDTPGVKMEAPLNVPAGPRQLTVMNSAIDFKRDLGDAASKNDSMFVNADGSKITTTQMTKVLQKIEVPGIMFDTETGKDINFLQEAYDLRRLHATLSFSLYNDYGPGAAMRGRAIKTGTGSESDYVSPRPGFYNQKMLEPHVRVNTFFSNAYMKDVAKSTNNPSESLLGIPTEDAAKLAEEAKATASPIAYPGKRVAFNIDLASGTSSITFEDSTSPIGMQGQATQDLIVNVRPPKPSARDVKPLVVDVTQAMAEEAAESPVDAEKARPKLQAYLERIRKFKPGSGTKTGMVGLGVAGVLGASEEAYTQELERSGSTLRATAAGTLRGAYEAAETPLLMGLTIGEAGAKGIADQPADLPGRGPIETEFTREQAIAEMDARDQGFIPDTRNERLNTIEEFERRQAVIDEQKARISAYDERKRSLEDQTNELLQRGE